MNKLAALLAMLLSAFAVAACGSSDEQITPETLAAAMDEVCSETNAEFDALGTRGLTNPALALELEGTAEIRQSVIDGFSELDVNEEAKAELDRYIAASEELIKQDNAIVAAASKDDDEAVAKAFSGQDAAFTERDAIAEEIGTEVCGKSPDIQVEETGTEPPEDLTYSEPKNTIEEAADQYVKDGGSGDCAAMNRNRHTDAGELERENCEAVAKVLKDATVAGTESYGPVGQAEIVSADGTHYPTYFVNDLDGMLRYGGDAIHDGGGLRPAPEGNDADATAEATLAAIRENDAAAFNEILPDKSSGFWLDDEGEFDTFSSGGYNAGFVEDIRDTDVEPVPLGLNSAFGFYFVEGSEYDWVVTLIHIPGTGGHYRFSGYYPIPKA